MSDSTDFNSESFKGEEDAIKWLKGALGRDYPSTPVYLPAVSSD